MFCVIMCIAVGISKKVVPRSTRDDAESYHLVSSKNVSVSVYVDVSVRQLTYSSKGP